MKSMKAARVNRTVALVMMLITGIIVPASAQDRPQATPPKPVKADAEAPAQVTQGLGAFGKVLPVGEKNLDVKIPSFKDGLPSSTLRAGSMTRVDDENMQMERMDIRLYGETHDKDVRIQLPTAVYHMPSQILSSITRSRVSRDDFDLQGDSMIFDTRTQQGKMVGNVRMVIYDADAFAPQPKKEKTSSKDKPAAASPEASPAPTAPPSPPANDKK